MSSTVLKYILAATISLSGCALSILWYRMAKQAFLVGDVSGEKLAVLQSGKGDIDRKPGQRLIWQPLTDGTALLNGDTIRTGPRGEGRVALLESGTVIALEPDSLIVIEKSKGKLSLDLLSGGLFIKSQSKSNTAAAPTIKAGNTKFSLGAAGAEMNLSIDKGKTATLSVSKGNIDVDANGKQVTLKEGDAGAISNKGSINEQKVIQVMGPLADAVLDIGATGNEPILFTWSPISGSLKIYLETGPSRSELKRQTSQGIPASTGMLATILPAGSFYWRLAAVDGVSGQPSTSSLVYKASTVSLSPPTLIAPKKGEQFFLSEKNVDVQASWSNPQFSEKTILVVARTRDFKDVLFQKSFTGESEAPVAFKDSGTYYWRVLAFFSGRAKPLSSEIAEIIINDKLDLRAPTLVKPENNTIIPLVKAKTGGLFFEWSEISGIENYKIEVKSDAPDVNIDETISLAQFRLEKIHPGKYMWKVKSIGPAKESSEWSKSFSFQIIEMGSITWEDPKGDDYRYSTKEASVSLAWNKGSDSAKKWGFRFAKEKEGLLTKNWTYLAATKITAKLPTEGAYFFDVQAFDEAGGVLAMAKTRQINILPPPAPPAPPALAAPEFVDFEKKLKRSDADGSIKIEWHAVKNATSYIILLSDPDQKTPKKFERNSRDLHLTGLNPGRYKIKISAINEQGNQGEFSEENYIEVPNISSIAAPKVKLIKVH